MRSNNDDSLKEDLRDWFGKSKSKDGKPGWVQADGSPCANEKEDGDKTPKCFSSKRLASLKAQGEKGEAKIRSAVRRKREKDKGQQSKSGGAKPTMVRTFKDKDDYKKHPSGDKHESFNPMQKENREDLSPIVQRVLDRHFAEEELKNLEEANKPTNPKLWARAKSLARQKFDVYPSAYANGWASKWYKSKGGGWKSVSEEVDPNEETLEVCPHCGCDPCECEGEEVSESVRIPAQSGNIYIVTFTWRGKYLSMKVFFPELKTPTRKEVQAALDKIYPGCMIQRYDLTLSQPGEPMIHAGLQGGSLGKFGSNKNYVKPMGEGVEIEDLNGNKFAEVVDVITNDDLEVAEGAAWTKKAGKSESGGLNEKGRKSYERENPGSDLKAPSKKVGNKRRASFCARMKGMKKKLTSSKTANDPDSRINKSLRAWNC